MPWSGRRAGSFLAPSFLTRGTLVLEGRPVRFATPRDAQRAGVAAVSQELTLVPQLSVIDNVFLGIEQRRFGMVARRAIQRSVSRPWSE